MFHDGMQTWTKQSDCITDLWHTSLKEVRAKLLTYATRNDSVRPKAREIVCKHCAPADRNVPPGVQTDNSDAAIHLY